MVLLMAIRAGYFAIGGAAALGTVMATVVRILLSALVLAVPTILMGGHPSVPDRGSGDTRQCGGRSDPTPSPAS